MDMKAYYKTSLGKVVELEQRDKLNLYNMDIIELIIPDGCETVWCWNNQLKELIIPEGCKRVDCENNQLKELIIPDECKWVRADLKSMTELNKVYDLNLYI